MDTKTGPAAVKFACFRILMRMFFPHNDALKPPVPPQSAGWVRGEKRRE
jgi:hypothetical protein